MIDEKEILKHNVEMAEHAKGTAQFMGPLVCGRYVTKEQAREKMDFLLAPTKRNIESWLNATRQEKDVENVLERISDELTETTDGTIIIRL